MMLFYRAQSCSKGAEGKTYPLPYSGEQRVMKEEKGGSWRATAKWNKSKGKVEVIC